MGVERTEISDLMRGEVRAELFGAFPAGVLNAATAEGIALWAVESLDAHTLRLRFYEGELPEMEALAAGSACELRILRQRGGRGGLRHLGRRAGLLLGLVMAALALFASSLFVWDVEVRGNERLTSGEILRAAEDCGLGAGSFWPALRTEKLRSALMLRLPELSWMSVNVSGSRAVLAVVERAEKPPVYDASAACDLLAARGGLIRRLNILAGSPMVSEGQLVAEGELLVSGRQESLAGSPKPLQARGAVMADTWVELSAVRLREELMKTPAGLPRSRFALVVGKRRLNLYFDSGKAIDGCDKIVSEHTLGVKGLFSLPLTLVRERFVPYHVEPGTDGDAERSARRLYALLEARTEGQILSSSFRLSNAGELRVLTLRAHCLENIAKPQTVGG